MDNLAVIPARGGSVRIPHKNIKEFGGHPLITWTISAAKESGIFDRIVVTTDDYEIARVASIYEAEIYNRDPELAGDHVPVSRATVDVIEKYSGYENVAQLLPTCPLRNAEDVKKSYHSFALDSCYEETKAQISVADFGWQNPWWMVVEDEIWFWEEGMIVKRSQDLPESYSPTGAVWWAKTDYLLEQGSFYTGNTEYWIMPRHRAVDIDTMDDWRVADAFRRFYADL